MIQLFDRYHQESKDLHESLMLAGFKGQAIVIEPDGFLPEDILSPFHYYIESANQTGKALFFDQVPVPPFWEIKGDNQSATITNQAEVRGRIHYVDTHQPRLVKQVEWLNKQGITRQTDHYNKFGFCFAKTTHGAQGAPIFTKYITKNGDDRILENHVTGDILLIQPKQPMKHFKNRIAFVGDFIQNVVKETGQILFNSLATSFMVSYGMNGNPGSDFLVWQEPLGSEIPGNMNLILEDNVIRANAVVIPDRSTYKRALELVPEKWHHKLIPLGYSYQFKRDNFIRKDILIATNSDQIEQLETLVTALPDTTFRIAAVTEMSAKLLSMMRFPNVILYQNVSESQLYGLYQLSDILLDINYANELRQANRTAFMHNMLILAFSETVHDRTFVAPEHIFLKEAVEKMIAKIKEVTNGVEEMQQALLKQGRQGNYIRSTLFAEQLAPLIGG